MNLLKAAICFSAMTVLIGACGHKEAASVDPKVIQKAFESSTPEVREQVTSSAQAFRAATAERNDALKAEQYRQALQPIGNVVSKSQLSKEQLAVMVKQFQEINKSVQSNPRLVNDKQLYQARNAAAQALYRAGVMP